MAWTETNPAGIYFICFRLGDQRFRRSLKTREKRRADSLATRLEENLELLQRGRLELPANADVVAFLLSDGRLTGTIAVPDQTKLKELFDAYFDAIPEGNLEETTIYGMKLHRKQLENHFGATFPIRTLTRNHLQGFIDARRLCKGKQGRPIRPATIKKVIVTLRTVWNWAVQANLVEGRFPNKGLKYPKSQEKSPFKSFQEVEALTKSGKADPELWDCVYLTVADLDALLKHVETARHPFVHPMFVFAAHTGARRAEIMRCRVRDIDLEGGWVTLHERKRVHDTKTTRQIPLSPKLQAVLSDWIAHHPGGEFLFCHAAEVANSRIRSPMTGYATKNRPTTVAKRQARVSKREAPPIGSLTRDVMHDHFKRAIADSKWAKLKGFHVLRHSFISCLAASGCDQRVIDDFVGHTTEEQRRRYRHLFPGVTKKAIAAVFG